MSFQKRTWRFWFALLGTGTIATLAQIAARGTALAASPETKVDYNRDIRPILSNNCFKCHGPDATERQAGLRLDIRAEALKPTESGNRAIVPGDAEKSRLVRRIFSAKANVMPPPESNKKLAEGEKQLLKQWIEQGAEYQAHWSFSPPQRPPSPTVNNRTWPRNAIDYFVLERLEKEGLYPSPETDRITYVRRLTLDLTGLPPTPAEVDDFLADTCADAYEKVVDRLLASPRFGERLAVDWLDAARYADTHGYHIDSGRDMSLWREWVINSFNGNLSFDRFTIEQLAGDLLPNPTLDQRIASGFNRNHMINFEGGAIPEEYHTAYIVDRVNTTSTVWLGLTVACAQCHDHKYDPISQKEYYQLYAFFNNVPEKGLDGATGNAAPLLKTPTPLQQKKLKELAAAMKQIEQQLAGPLPEVEAEQSQWEKAVRDHQLDQFQLPGKDAKGPQAAKKLPPSIIGILALPAIYRTTFQQAELRAYFRGNFSTTIKTFQDRLGRLQKEKVDWEKQVPTTMVMEEMPKPRDTFMLVRGQYDKHGEKVPPGVPVSLSSLPRGAPPTRLGLAQWLVDPNHPLTARVAVNRYWQIFFGTGLVKTAEDFGSQGELPSHPELLDWMATEFVHRGWNIKAMLRLMVTSATYRQSSVVTPALFARDPENRLLARGPRLRLQAEFIRDQALAISGALDGRIGGKSVSPYQPPGLWEELASRQDGAKWTAQTYVQSKGRDLYRRTMYTFWKRTSPPPTLVTFDAPDRETCTVRRSRTNTPLQALVLMNDPTYVEASRQLAQRLMIEAGSPEERIVLAFRLATARQPSAGEMKVLRRLFDDQWAVFRKDGQAAIKLLAVGESRLNEKLDVAELAAWTTVASVILNLDETVTKG
jgi:hypothetical protein